MHFKEVLREVFKRQKRKQAGAEMGQAQLKLGSVFTLFFVDLVSLDLVW